MNQQSETCVVRWWRYDKLTGRLLYASRAHLAEDDALTLCGKHIPEDREPETTVAFDELHTTCRSCGRIAERREQTGRERESIDRRIKSALNIAPMSYGSFLLEELSKAVGDDLDERAIITSLKRMGFTKRLSGLWWHPSRPATGGK